MIGVEVERVAQRGLPRVDGNAERFLVGKVVEAGKHPNADKLQLCRVDTGDPEPRQIVCGAWNFGAGDTVAVAVPGAVLPDGRVLGQAKLRGLVSDGMILSERELDVSQEHGGILVLGDGYEAGEPLGDRLPLSDEVLELEVSSNRSDLLSVRGVARDLAAAFDLRLRPLEDEDPDAEGSRPTSAFVRIAIDDLDLCSRFTARAFEGVTIGPSPLWLKARLSAAGIRPISNVVDITNYVMHDLGSPLHGYDHARIAGPELVARRARAGERIVTIDHKERELEPDMLVIADADGPVGIAGIMGGAGSEIADTTTTVVLEAANFDRVQIMRTSHRIGLRSDASNRWEKGVDPHLAPVAARAAARLLVELTRRAHGARADRRRRPPAGPGGAAPARAPARRDHRDRDPGERGGRDPRPARLRAAPRRRRLGRHRPDAPLARRDPRDRPGRGGRPHPRPRQGAVAAALRGPRRRAHPQPALPPVAGRRRLRRRGATRP